MSHRPWNLQLFQNEAGQNLVFRNQPPADSQFRQKISLGERKYKVGGREITVTVEVTFVKS